MHFMEFYEKVENIFKLEIKNAFPYDWDENYITRRLLTKMRDELDHIIVEGFRFSLTSFMNVFKLTGNAEKQFGDIALIVFLQFYDGDSFEGVAFLEAKKREQNHIRFNALKKDQLQKIYRNSPHAQVLLYDYRDICNYAKSFNYNEVNRHFRNPFIHPHITTSTNIVVVPMQNVIKINKKDITLYKLGEPFSHQLCFRYFHGFDLDLRKKSLDIAKGFAEKKGFPKYIIALNIVERESEPKEFIEINKSIYEPIERY